MESKRYLSVRTKFIITISVVILWTVVCTFIEIPWFIGLSEVFSPILAFMIIFCLAFLPGIMIVIIICGIVMDRPRRHEIVESALEDITILIAAYNEEDCIYETLMSLSRQRYPKNMYIKVIDNNSDDDTRKEISRAKADFRDMNIEYIFEPTQGKFAALNTGLATTETRFVLTIDADTWLYEDAIIRLTNMMIRENVNKDVASIAGTVLVRNSRTNLLTRMQEWDYFLSIAAIKRCQGLFQTTLVAQGAFSIYDTCLAKAIGGWKDSIGEDIVLTWELLSQGYKTYYCDNAVAFTNVPTELKVFTKQRTRWARGMVEGFRHFSFKGCKNPYARVFIFMDLFLFAIDFGISFFYIPGLVMAIFFGKFYIVGPMTIILMPITIIFFIIMAQKEYRYVFKESELKIRKNYPALLAFMVLYSIILSPACLKGYFDELFRRKRKWK